MIKRKVNRNYILKWTQAREKTSCRSSEDEKSVQIFGHAINAPFVSGISLIFFLLKIPFRDSLMRREIFL